MWFTSWQLPMPKTRPLLPRGPCLLQRHGPCAVGAKGEQLRAQSLQCSQCISKLLCRRHLETRQAHWAGTSGRPSTCTCSCDFRPCKLTSTQSASSCTAHAATLQWGFKRVGKRVTIDAAGNLVLRPR